MKTLIASTALALMLSTGIAAVPASAAQDSTQLIATLPGEALPISDYYNQNVYDVSDNKIGEINDLLVDNAGKVNAVIVGVGGFLGVGEKNVAVAFSSLKVAEKDGKRYLVLDTTRKCSSPRPAIPTTAARARGCRRPSRANFATATFANGPGRSGPFVFCANHP